MADCPFCGLHFGNVQAYGPHKRACLRRSNLGDDVISDFSCSSEEQQEQQEQQEEQEEQEEQGLWGLAQRSPVGYGEESTPPAPPRGMFQASPEFIQDYCGMQGMWLDYTSKVASVCCDTFWQTFSLLRHERGLLMYTQPFAAVLTSFVRSLSG